MSSADGDGGWGDAPQTLPSGGSVGQALVKQSSLDNDADWEDVVHSIAPNFAIDVDNTDPANPVIAVDPEPLVCNAADRTALKALDTSRFKTAFLKEGIRAGIFEWKTGDYSAQISADTLEGICIKADAIAATVGAWVRVGGWIVSGLDARWWGVVGDSNGTTGNGTNNSTAVQLVVTLAQNNVYGTCSARLPSGIIRLGSQITASKKIDLRGAGMALPAQRPNPVFTSFAPGTVLYIDHTGIGLRFEAPNDTDIVFDGYVGALTTFRNQPAPAPGWAPNVLGADFSTYLYAPTFERVATLNPYIAFDIERSGAVQFKHIRGQPLHRGWVVRNNLDVIRWDDIHCWPYWALDSSNFYVFDYTVTNARLFDLGRCDNPQFSNIFAIYYFIGINLNDDDPNGITTRLKGTNVELDAGRHAMVIESGVDGALVELANFIHYGSSRAAITLGGTGYGLLAQGSNCIVNIANMDDFGSADSVIAATGTGNVITVSGYNFRQWGLRTGSTYAINAAAGNLVYLLGPNNISSSASPNKFSGNGITVDEWRAFTPTITSSSGTITTVSGVSAKYRRQGHTIDFNVTFTITTNGTGAGAVQVNGMPAAGASVGVVGIGQAGINTCRGNIQSGTARLDISKYDGTYPGADATTFRISGSYEAA